MPDFGDVDPTTGAPSPRTNYSGTYDPNAPSVLNGQITPEQWAAYQAKRKRDMLMGTLLTLGGMGAAGALPMAFGAGGAAGSASVPGAIGAAEAPLGVGTVTAGTSLAPYAGTIAGTAAGTAKGVGSGIGAGAAGAAGAAGKGFLGMSPQELASLAMGITGTVGGALSKPPNMSPNTMTTDPNLQRLLQTMQGRLNKSEPLFDSVMQMANGLLPMEYQKKGGGGMG